MKHKIITAIVAATMLTGPAMAIPQRMVIPPLNLVVTAGKRIKIPACCADLPREAPAATDILSHVLTAGSDSEIVLRDGRTIPFQKALESGDIIISGNGTAAGVELISKYEGPVTIKSRSAIGLSTVAESAPESHLLTAVEKSVKAPIDNADANISFETQCTVWLSSYDRVLPTLRGIDSIERSKIESQIESLRRLAGMSDQELIKEIKADAEAQSELGKMMKSGASETEAVAILKLNWEASTARGLRDKITPHLRAELESSIFPRAERSLLDCPNSDSLRKQLEREQQELQELKEGALPFSLSDPFCLNEIHGMLKIKTTVIAIENKAILHKLPPSQVELVAANLDTAMANELQGNPDLIIVVLATEESKPFAQFYGSSDSASGIVGWRLPLKSFKPSELQAYHTRANYLKGKLRMDEGESSLHPIVTSAERLRYEVGASDVAAVKTMLSYGLIQENSTIVRLPSGLHRVSEFTGPDKARRLVYSLSKESPVFVDDVATIPQLSKVLQQPTTWDDTRVFSFVKHQDTIDALSTIPKSNLKQFDFNQCRKLDWDSVLSKNRNRNVIVLCEFKGGRPYYVDGSNNFTPLLPDGMEPSTLMESARRNNTNLMFAACNSGKSGNGPLGFIGSTNVAKALSANLNGSTFESLLNSIAATSDTKTFHLTADYANGVVITKLQPMVKAQQKDDLLTAAVTGFVIAVVVPGGGNPPVKEESNHTIPIAVGGALGVAYFARRRNRRRKSDELRRQIVTVRKS